jgi:DNA-binding transcriptional regulator YdaS (Cro superfamily)
MEKIRVWRIGRAISIDEAGSLVGVSGVQWHRYESGKRRVPAEKVQAISKITGIPPHEIRPDVFQQHSGAAP